MKITLLPQRGHRRRIYIKLQDAYVAETGVYYGSWELIGYTMPASSNFNYAGYQGANQKTSITTAKTDAWKAEAKATLNDCPASSKWHLDIAQNSSTGGSVTYEAGIDNKTECLPLTPNFAAFSSDKTTLN